MLGIESWRGHWRSLASALGVAGLIAVVVLPEVVPQLAVLDLDIVLQAIGALAHHVAGLNVTHLLATYGYWAVLLFVLARRSSGTRGTACGAACHRAAAARGSIGTHSPSSL